MKIYVKYQENVAPKEMVRRDPIDIQIILLLAFSSYDLSNMV